MQTIILRSTTLYLLLFLLFGCQREPDVTPPPPSPTAITRLPLPEMVLTVEMPTQVELGQRYNVLVRVNHLSADMIENLTVLLPIPDGAVSLVTPIDATETAGILSWTIEKMQAGASLTELLTFEAPFEPRNVMLPEAQLQLNGETIAVTVAQPFVVAGGQLPVRVARQKIGELVSVSGAVSYYSQRVFYIADQSGGIRVQIADGAPNITFELGQMVTVTGTVVPYDGSVAILLDAERVEATPCFDCAPLEIVPSFDQKALGTLVTQSGTVRDIVSMVDGTQIGLTDVTGELLQIWLDGRLGISADAVTPSQQLTIVGIYDDWNGNRAIALRQQADLAPIFPPTLRLTFDAPVSVPLSEPLTHTITLYNDSDETRTNVVVSAAVPRLVDDLFAGTILTTTGNGQLGTDGILYWGVPEMVPNSSQTFSFQIQYFSEGRATTTVSARAENSPEPITRRETLYVGQPVPIFAIQEGDRSPLRGREVLVEGIVTLVTPLRQGFFLQQPSDLLVRGVGVFVETTGEPTVQSGDAVRVRGIVQERNDETVIAASRDEIIVLSADNPLPEALPFDLPTDSAETQSYMEPFEGMLIALGEPMLVVSDTTAQGITTLVYARHGLESAAAYLMTVKGLDQVRRGDRVEPFLGVVAAEFDDYYILPKK
jgi:hypothetical protein